MLSSSNSLKWHCTVNLSLFFESSSPVWQTSVFAVTGLWLRKFKRTRFVNAEQCKVILKVKWANSYQITTFKEGKNGKESTDTSMVLPFWTFSLYLSLQTLLERFFNLYFCFSASNSIFQNISKEWNTIMLLIPIGVQPNHKVLPVNPPLVVIHFSI